MNDGSRRRRAALLGAAFPAMVALSFAAGQRGGGSAGVGGGDDPYVSIGRGAAGLNRGIPNQNQVQPPISDADAKAKSDHEQNIKDAARLAQLATEVRQELESGGDFTLSLASLKKTDEMEKLSKKLHARMKGDEAAGPKPPPGANASQRTKR
jgi:hypothetical protein